MMSCSMGELTGNDHERSSKDGQNKQEFTEETVCWAAQERTNEEEKERERERERSMGAVGPIARVAFSALAFLQALHFK